MIHVITGPMFSGKTTKLSQYLLRHHLKGENILYIVPDIDTRTKEQVKISTIRQEFCIPVTKLPVEITGVPLFQRTEFMNADVIAFDESQFFGEEIIKEIQCLHYAGKIVYVCGLDMDHLLEPFGSMGNLMAIASSLEKLTAICECGEPATYTKRISKDESLIQIGDMHYIPRYNDCYSKPYLKSYMLQSL